MGRRRGNARRLPSAQPGRRLPNSVLLASGARRRPASRRRRAFASALLLVVVAGVAVVIASATSSERAASGSPRAAAAPGASLARARPSATRPAARKLSSEDEVIGRVLAYTPFVRRGRPVRRMVALTFDDGPSPYTPQIVRVLVRLRAPATFFIVGQQLRYFAHGLRDELRHGFVIGDHTQNHAPLNLLGAAAKYRQIDAAAAAIARAGGRFPRLFRPPYGMYDGQTFRILRRLRMLMILWSVDPRDWMRPGTRAIVQRVLEAVRPGAIVELHDGGGDRSQTAAALPAIIRALRRRHFQLVTVPQLLAADPPPRHEPLPHVSE